MKIPKELAEQIATADPEWLWNQFTLLDDIPNYQQQYNKVRYGLQIKDFEIFDLWKPTGVIKPLPTSNRVSIRGKIYKLTDYYTEEQNRINIMRKTIYENLSEDTPLRPR